MFFKKVTKPYDVRSLRTDVLNESAKLFSKMNGEHSKITRKRNMYTPMLTKDNHFFVELSLDSTVSVMKNLREMFNDIIFLVRNSKYDGEQANVTVNLIITSGGGEVTAYGMITEMVKTLKKHVTVNAIVDQVAASGGYMLAAVCDSITVAPFSYTGSVGVVASVPNYHELLQTYGVKVIEETAGKSKRSITPTSSVTSDKIDRFRQDLERIHSLFIKHVREYRDIEDEMVDNILDGSVFCGEEAIEKGLADKIGTSFDIIDSILNETNDSVFLFTPSSKQYESKGLLSELRGLVAEVKGLLKTNIELK